MKIFLTGQRSFGAAVASLIVELGHDLVGVASPPWRDTDIFFPHAGPDADLTRRAAESFGVPWVDSSQLRAPAVPEGTDLIVAAHSHAFVGRATRARARVGAIGYHPSLLPLHRGRDAVRWAVRMRERVTGGSVYWLTDGVDTGPIAAQRHVFIRAKDTAGDLWRRDLLPLGLLLLRKVIGDIDAGHLVQVPQREELATWEPSLERAPLFRPELPQLGDGRATGPTVTADPAALF